MEEQMVNIKHNLKVAQIGKRVYVYKIRTHREFKVGEHVFLKVNVTSPFSNPKLAMYIVNVMYGREPKRCNM
jgi:hypothetical protein